MSNSMLEYTKIVLKKVSFDTLLFCKELRKALNALMPEEAEELRIWLEHYIMDKPELKQSLTYLKV